MKKDEINYPAIYLSILLTIIGVIGWWPINHDAGIFWTLLCCIVMSFVCNILGFLATIIIVGWPVVLIFRKKDRVEFGGLDNLSELGWKITIITTIAIGITINLLYIIHLYKINS